MSHRLSWRQTCGYLQLAFSCLLSHLLLSGLGWGWTVKAFVVCILGLFSPHCRCLCCESHLGVYGDRPGRRCAGLLGSLQGPSGQVCSPIKHQKQPDINPPWGPVWSRCMADMPLLEANMKVRQWTQPKSKLHTQLDVQDWITSDMSQSFSCQTSQMWVLALQSAKIN